MFCVAPASYHQNQGLRNLPSVSHVLDILVAKFHIPREEWKFRVRDMIAALVDALEDGTLEVLYFVL